jgi:NTP pyrophosphatase (non-canonical NTP hydrolase)
MDLTEIEKATGVLVDVCHGASARAGWWGATNDGADAPADVTLVRDGSTRFGKALVAQKLCLIHSEVSEAMEGHRKNLDDDKLPHRKMIEVELADALIRICDLAGALNLDLGGAVAEKLEFNAQRADHKPENRAAENGKSY